ncbi:MAG: two-component sensor histidine kinase [Rhizobiales bacterium]|nr:two-component sensor histidine kinase [Hyphomicrobiales bacterium]
MIAPMVLMQTIMAGIILERHWDNVSRVLARSLAREIALLVELNTKGESLAEIERLARDKLSLDFTVVRNGTLPPEVEPSMFALAAERLSRYLARETKRPFRVNTAGSEGHVEIAVDVGNGVIYSIKVREERAYAASTDMLLMWMLASSLFLLGIAVIFLKKQITPIIDLAHAAQRFGMGQEAGDFRPRGATEVRQAGVAFLDMKDRLARHVEQRTAMLAGVSHDLRTILTRFKLELAFLGDGPKIKPLKEDVDEMQRMLEAYMAFVKGDGGETSSETDVSALVASVAASLDRKGKSIEVKELEKVVGRLKPNAFRRLLSNLIGNAVRYAEHVKVESRSGDGFLEIVVDDNGPGIPVGLREDAFRPFVRLDHARNLDETGTGLGLAIARDIAHAHGGEIELIDSPMGGLRARLRVPV